MTHDEDNDDYKVLPRTTLAEVENDKTLNFYKTLNFF